MGPAVFTAGEFCPRRSRTGARRASMGPAVFTAGETFLSRREFYRSDSASMGPAVFTAGEMATLDSVAAAALELQWGPRFSPRESWISHRPCGSRPTLQWGPRFSPRERALWISSVISMGYGVLCERWGERSTSARGCRAARGPQETEFFWNCQRAAALRAVPGIRRAPRRSRGQTMTGARSEGT